MKAKIMVLVVLMLFPVLARAEGQDAERALADRYVQLTCTDDPSAFFIGIIDSMLGLQDSDGKLVQAIHDLLGRLDWDLILENYKAKLIVVLTQNELERLVEFYSGDMGAALLAKQNKFAEAAGALFQEMAGVGDPTELDVSGLDPAKKELAGRFMDLWTGGDVHAYFLEEIRKNAVANGATKEQLDQIAQVMGAYDWGWFAQALVAKLTQAYSVEELEALVEFMATPGTVETMKKLVLISQTLQQDLLQQLDRAMREYKAEKG